MTNPTGSLGDKTVKRIGFGAMQLAGPGVFGPPKDPDAARAVLRRAIELGVDHIDTSQFYGPNVVNELIHETLHPYPDDLKLVTKVGARRDDQGAWISDLRPEALRQGVEENLATLGVERLDLVNLRVADDDGPGKASVPTAEQLGTLAELRDEGKLDLIGVSNVTKAGLDAALEIEPKIGQVQNAYSIIDREHDDLVDACEAHGIAFVPFFPLGSAFTGGPKKLAEDPAIAAVAQRHQATPSQVALAWLLARSERILLIPGTSTVAHLEENLGAGDVDLTPEDLEQLAQVEHVGNPMAGAH